VLAMEAIEQSKQQQLQTIRVLIADDDPPTRVLLRTAISQWGYSSVEAKDGEEAWEILQTPEPPRLLILDWLMPKIDGIALCTRIKQKTNFHPYIILLTHMSGTVNVTKGLEAGADEFLSKPFNMAELRSRLDVGARIIKFEHALAESKTELQTYVSHLKKISYLIGDVSNQVEDFCKMDSIMQAAQKDIAGSQKIQELQISLSNIAQLLKVFSLNQKNEDKI
jgi:DNA-binding response OmpR family regulator